MKKNLALIISALMIFALAFTGCSKKDDNAKLTTVKLNEVVRSVFYAPMYVAITEGFFEEEGIKIDLSTGQGADKTMQQVISGSADIGFCGPEQVIYINNQGKEDYPVLFAQLTQCDGSFLVGREEAKNFNWNDLKGKAVIGGRPGGVPEMAFEYVLRQNGLTPGEDVELITNVDFTATAGAFKAGTGDYVTLFEPTASSLVKDGGGYIVASIGESAGYIPYTCYFTTKSFMDKNADLLEKFTKAIYKGQLWADKHTNEEIAEKVIEFFPGMDQDILTSSIASYKSIGAYAATPTLTEEGLTNLMDIIESYNTELLPARPKFSKIVNNSFSEKVVKEYK